MGGAAAKQLEDVRAILEEPTAFDERGIWDIDGNRCWRASAVTRSE
jgi:hypothetical protein